MQHLRLHHGLQLKSGQAEQKGRCFSALFHFQDQGGNNAKAFFERPTRLPHFFENRRANSTIVLSIICSNKRICAKD
jgi:hypothetical protein